MRCKRQNQTYFVPVDRTDSFLTIKQRLSSSHGTNEITKEPVLPPSRIMFYLTPAGEKELPDAGTISDHEIGNDQVIFAVFQKDNGQWEPIEVEGAAGAAKSAEESKD